MLPQCIPTLYWYGAEQAEMEQIYQAHQQALEATGFQLQVLSDHKALFQAVTSTQRKNHGQFSPAIFLLSAHLKGALSLIARLRAQDPYVPLVIVQSVWDEATLLPFLYGGVDAYCIGTDSPELWAAKFSSLLRRIRVSVPMLDVTKVSSAKSFSPPDPMWALANEGWQLFSPDGRSITLTSTERFLLLELCRQPDKRASHQQLLRALNDGEEDTSDPVIAHNRLGVIISRLKRKGSLEGVAIPIRSVHKWGYMFSAPVCIE
ncbi:winged helix-turn-helix domain-containing protein [Paenalcaligenes sp.]|uniref:winged helix-turn-helix domain-containing protein n=1 Tax=Paenalcaligenes sp. TaxID=1966342 RepID=UPI0026387C19|nr:winged helix-turn-helix domain-containing protein [Paenalcaligenes sp.]